MNYIKGFLMVSASAVLLSISALLAVIAICTYGYRGQGMVYMNYGTPAACEFE